MIGHKKRIFVTGDMVVDSHIYHGTIKILTKSKRGEAGTFFKLD